MYKITKTILMSKVVLALITVQTKELEGSVHAGGGDEASVGAEPYPGSLGSVVVQDTQLIPLLTQIYSTITNQSLYY